MYCAGRFNLVLKAWGAYVLWREVRASPSPSSLEARNTLNAKTTEMRFRA